MAMERIKVEITKNLTDSFRKEFHSDQKNLVAQNACIRCDPYEVCLSRRVIEELTHVFQHRVDTEGKPVSNQKSSGRCWIFAALSGIRIPFMKSLNLEDFEFSHTYVYFWDKIERINYWLHSIVDTWKRGEARDSRLVSFLLNDPVSDGGQWDMFHNIVIKHGLVPKKCFPETYNSESSGRLNTLLRSVLRGYAKELRDMLDAEKFDLVPNRITAMMHSIYRVCCICLGTPPAEFTWEYLDKSKSYNSVGPISPIDFYSNHVKPVFNLDDKVCLVTDPRKTSPYQRAFTVDCLGNVIGGRPIIYNNQPVDVLMQLVGESIKNNEPVWFGCEVSKRFASKQGIEALDIHDFELVLGVNPSLNLTKAERMEYGDSSMSHAMLFTGVSYKNDLPWKFRVENSWGEDKGDKGYIVLTADWFKEFVFEVVVDKKFLSQEVLDVFKQTPIVLPPWDPMGTLAQF